MCVCVCVCVANKKIKISAVNTAYGCISLLIGVLDRILSVLDGILWKLIYLVVSCHYISTLVRKGMHSGLRVLRCSARIANKWWTFQQRRCLWFPIIKWWQQSYKSGIINQIWTSKLAFWEVYLEKTKKILATRNTQSAQELALVMQTTHAQCWQYPDRVD